MLLGLISPMNGIRNLDFSPETSGSDQTTSLWSSNSGDDQTSHDMDHAHGAIPPTIRTYGCEEDMYAEIRKLKEFYIVDWLTPISESMPTISLFILIFPYYLHPLSHSMRTGQSRFN
jgi:hypothetical protein